VSYSLLSSSLLMRSDFLYFCSFLSCFLDLDRLCPSEFIPLFLLFFLAIFSPPFSLRLLAFFIFFPLDFPFCYRSIEFFWVWLVPVARHWPFLSPPPPRFSLILSPVEGPQQVRFLFPLACGFSFCSIVFVKASCR